MDSAPSIYQQLLLTERTYRERTELPAALNSCGFKKYSDIQVPKVDAFMYLPSSFPINRTEASSFEFSSLRGKRLAVGICISGTWISTGWDEKCILGLMGEFKIDCNRPNADAASSAVLQCLNSFLDDFPELFQYDIKLDIYVSGYSLGGMYAQVITVALQDWAYTTSSTIDCRTFDNPGIPETCHVISRNFDGGDPGFWKSRITNYKSYPSLLNTVFKDLGRVIHLMNKEDINRWDPRWVMKCLSGSARRLTLWGSMAMTLIALVNSTKEDTSDQENDKEDAKEGDEGNSHEAMIGILATTAALDLGMDLLEIVHNHDLKRMLKCFDAVNGQMLQGVSLEMQEWPVYDSLEATGMKLLKDAVNGCILMHPSNVGIHTLLGFGGKRGFIERKLSNMEGYVPLRNP